MKILLFLLTAFSLFAKPSIVFIHLGKELPDYLPNAVSQARLFNECPIYLIANECALQTIPDELQKARAICVAAESLLSEPQHEWFKRVSRLDRHFRGGFWLFTTERFFYLYELMKKYDLSDVFHLEYDNMLYANVQSLLPVFYRFYSGKIGATFDNDNRCVAGFFYVADRHPLGKFLEFVVKNVRKETNDMGFLAGFRNSEEGFCIEQLPIVGPSYVEERGLRSAYNHVTSRPELFFNHFEEFQSVFDAAALGQYLGGEDPSNGNKGPGFINESCLFNPSFFQYEWRQDVAGRLVPFLVYRNVAWPIVNLHIHCKNLKLFHSGREKP